MMLSSVRGMQIKHAFQMNSLVRLNVNVKGGKKKDFELPITIPLNAKPTAIGNFSSCYSQLRVQA